MSSLLHHPDTHYLGKQAPGRPHAMVHEFVDVERIAPQIPANIINSRGPNGTLTALAMYLNDREGDCTIAGAANTLRVNSNGSQRITDQDVQTGYVHVTGREGAAFNPATGQNDNGCVEVDVLDYWVHTGIGGDKLLGHAGIDVANTDEMRAVLYLFGSIYPGWALSTDQQTQPIWKPGRAAAGSWGGHCAPIYDWYTHIPAGLKIGSTPIPAALGQVIVMGTWGAYKAASEPFLPFACDEAHGLITDAWIARNKGNPAIDMAKLTAYLKTLRPER
jgi:hypothetical protein